MTVVYILLLACMPILVEAQTWQPAARLWGMKMQPYVLHTQGHPPLIPLSKALDFPATDSFMFYAIPTLQPGAEAYGTLHGLSRLARPAVDFTDNSQPELIGPALEGGGLMLVDAYTPSERQRSIAMPGIDTPGDFGDPRAATVDCDGDGVTDVFRVETAKSLKIIYGDRQEPFSQASTALYYQPGEKVPIVEALGVIGGIPHVLKYSSVRNPQTDRDELQYILEELNPSDVRARRDTIRTRVVDRVVVTGELFWTVIITFDSLWHLPAYWQSDKPNTSLRVTRDGLEVVEVDPSFRAYDGYSLVGVLNYGQWKVGGQHTVRIDGHRPFLHEDDDDPNAAARLRWMELYRILDAGVLRTELLGRMDLADGSIEVGGLRSACLVPDIDGDMIEDAMVHYVAADPASDKGQGLVDLFLTTQRVGTSVGRDAPIDNTTDPDRSPTVVRLGPTTFQITMYHNLTELPPDARLIDVRGRDVGRARLTLVSASPKTTMFQAEVAGVVLPVWAQFGAITFKLQ